MLKSVQSVLQEAGVTSFTVKLKWTILARLDILVSGLRLVLTVSYDPLHSRFHSQKLHPRDNRLGPGNKYETNDDAALCSPLKRTTMLTCTRRVKQREHDSKRIQRRSSDMPQNMRFSQLRFYESMWDDDEAPRSFVHLSHILTIVRDVPRNVAYTLIVYNWISAEEHSVTTADEVKAVVSDIFTAQSTCADYFRIYAGGHWFCNDVCAPDLGSSNVKLFEVHLGGQAQMLWDRRPQ